MSNRIWIADRMREIKPSKIRQIRELADSKYNNPIHLDIGQPDFNTPKHIIEGAYKDAKAGYTTYTLNPGYRDLRQAIATKLRKVNNLDADPETEIVVTAGAQAALAMCFLTTLNPGDEVLVPEPYYTLDYIHLAGAKAKTIPLSEEKGFKVTVDQLQENITQKTKGLWLTNPSNPTGTLLGASSLENISKFAEDHDLLTYVDETYDQFVYDEKNHHSMLQFDEDKARTVSIFSFSKTYMMTGWRVGYVVANEEICSEVANLHQTFTSNVSSVSQRAAFAALDGPQDVVIEKRKLYQKNRDLVMEYVEQMPGVTCVKPEGAFYAFLNVKELGIPAEQLAIRILNEEPVAVAPGTQFGETVGKYHIRVSFPKDHQELEKGLSLLDKAISKIQD